MPALGTIFVELKADDKVFKQSLSEELKSAETTAKGIERVWKTMGENNDAQYAASARSYQNAMTLIKNSAEKTAADVIRAQSAMTAKINALNMEMANPQKAMWDTLGVRSTAVIEAQKAAVMSAWGNIKSTTEKGSQDWINAERAKNDKLKELNKEMVGDHEMSMASMTRAVLRLYAAWYVASTAIMTTKDFLMSGVKAIDDLKINTIAVASTLTSLQGTTGNIVENYHKNLIYADALNKKLMEIDANSFANYEQLQLMNRAMNTHGVILDNNNKKQVDAFTSISNAIALLTTGQNKEMQASQEMNALMTGRVKATDRVAMLVDGIIKQEGKYKDGLAEVIKLGKQHGDTLERLAPYYAGITVASADIGTTWAAVTSSLETAWGIVQRGLFKNIYKDLTVNGQDFAQWLKDNSDEIVSAINKITDTLGFAIKASITAMGVWAATAVVSLITAGNAVAAFTAKWVAMTTAINSTTSIMSRGFGIFVAAVAGFSIGNILNEFESVRRAGVLMVSGLIKAWDNLVVASKSIALELNPFTSEKEKATQRKALQEEYEYRKKLNRDFLVEEWENVTEAAKARDKLMSFATGNKNYMPEINDGNNGDVEKKAAELESALNQINEAIRKATYERDSVGLSQYEKDISRIKSDAEEYRKKGVDKVTVAKFVAIETELAMKKSYIAQQEAEQKAAEKYAHGQREYQRLVNETYEYSASEHERAINRIIARENDYLTSLERMLDRGLISWEQFENQVNVIKNNTKLATAEQEFKELSDKASFYSKIIGYEEEYRNKKLEWIDKEQERLAQFYEDDLAAAQWAAQEKGKLEYELFKKKTDYVSQGFGDLSSAFDGISRLYAEGSKDAENWKKASDAMLIAQKAVAVVQAVAAIATQGLGDPYTAFVRVAAMAAAMGALLATIGESVGGGTTAATSAPAMGNSTVLGAEYGTASESVMNSLSILEDTYSMEETKLSKIYNEMKDLNGNITALATNIVRTGSIGEIPFTPYDPQAMYKFMTNEITMGLTGIFPGDEIGKLIFGGIYKGLEGLFGGGAFAVGKQELWSSETGIKLGAGRIGDLVNGSGIDSKSYMEWVTRTTTDFWRDDSYDYNIRYAELSKDVTRMFDLVYSNLSSTLLELANQFGTDTQAALNYVFAEAKINLAGMTGEEVTAALQEYISKIGDEAVESLFGDIIGKYQQLNEGMLETATRLVTDMNIVQSMLGMTNQAFSGTVPEALKFSETLITIAGGLEKLTDAMQTYYDAFFSDAEKQSKLKEQLQAALGAYGFDLPGKRSGYRDVVESLNLTTEAGQAAYVALMQMSKSADQYYDYLEKAKGGIKESDYASRTDYLRAVRGYADGGISTGPESGYWAKLHGTELIVSPKNGYSATVVGESNVVLIEELRALRDELRQVTKNTKDTARNTKPLDEWNEIGIPATQS